MVFRAEEDETYEGTSHFKLSQMKQHRVPGLDKGFVVKLRNDNSEKQGSAEYCHVLFEKVKSLHGLRDTEYDNFSLR